jgi:hypothetical protein
MATAEKDTPDLDKKDARGIPATVREAWMSVLGVFTTAEHKLMESLGLNPEQPLGAELLARIKKNREELERRVDEGVKTAVARVRAPIDKELADMKARVDKLRAKVDEQKRRRADKKQA